ncbi:hypothetical protein NQ317_017518 [Molorchus minor]|uniref:Uncharacterized protein n=1 Tax=Molorchus minor TaxID=1323400 RepID=A0ABQ9JRK5_9CUCU|nr:hypothetical protein NQ317_017518 [Molorchus minor]
MAVDKSNITLNIVYTRVYDTIVIKSLVKAIVDMRFKYSMEEPDDKKGDRVSNLACVYKDQGANWAPKMKESIRCCL